MAPPDQLPEVDRPDIGQGAAKPELSARENGDLYNEHGDDQERAKLQAVDGGGETTPRKRGHLKAVGGKGAGSDDDKLDYLLGSGYIDDAPNRRERFRRKFTRRRVAAGVAVGTFGVGGSALLFLLFIPLKVENIVQNVENRYFSTSETALSSETDNVFTSWLKTQLAPSLKKGDCSRSGHVIISKDCTINVASTGKDPITNLYKTWAQAKLENQLSDTYGLELRYDPGGKGTFYLKAPGISGGEAKVGDGVKGINDSEFSAVEGRNNVRQAFRDAEKGMTLWDKVLFRYKVGRLLEEKYGIKRCIVFCGSRDALADDNADRKYSAKLFLTERVIKPRAAALGSVIGCLLDQNQCAQRESTTCTESNCDELDGEPQTKADGDVEKSVAAASSDFGSETAKKLTQNISSIREAGGVQNYLIETIFTKLFGQETGEAAVPVIGWLQILSTVSHFIAKAAVATVVIKKFSYLVNSQSAVSTFSTFQTYADEIHTGHVNATEVGSFNNALGPGSQCAQPLEGSCGQQLGGTAGAEQTPLYNDVIGGDTPQIPGNNVSSFLTDTVSPKAYADSGSPDASNGPAYRCNDGNPVPASTFPVCPEEKLGQTNNVAKGLSASLNSSGLAGLANAFNNIPGLSTALNLGNDLIGWLASGAASAVEGAVKILPGGAAVISNATTEAAKFFTFLGSKIILPFESTDQSGGRTGDAIIIGGDAAGNDYGHNGLGGHVLSPTEDADIVNQQQDQEKQQFDSQPFFARMFSTDSTDSLVSKIAMDIPFGLQNEIQSGFANLLNPLSAISHGFAAIFAGHANAAIPPQPDPAGIAQYGLTAQDIAPVNTGAKAKAYWNKNCSDNASYAYMKTNSWNKAAAKTIDPNTGMPENTTPNLCAFLKTTGGVAGGALDSSNLTPDDLADVNGSGGSPGTGSPSGGPVTGIPGSGSGSFTTDTSHPAYPGLDKMLARVKEADKDPGPFCASIGGCSGKCESAVEMAWLGHRGQYADPFGNSNPNGSPGPDSAWAAGLASGHAHPGDRNPPVGALLIYTIPGDQFGHITIYLGNNQVFSTDFDDQGSVGIQPASHIETASWANSYVGWMDPYFSGKVGD